ncbi:MFS transporter [Cellulomonas marina]|uniref:Predicted arabinose efflux permease, MFS family n=1 Tax=Cellulomonas marina TaxID=988821 RepID=A0A1I0V4R7_9CELL|nr:MFS transporter [Cellulomonas marina]GIG28337.1 MFS transporter [Cellulomonas marina]SFA71324.1 Predicted arabinose efflux permease, MFS family [Cellulomonas marina]
MSSDPKPPARGGALSFLTPTALAAVFAPALLFEVGIGAVIPMVAVRASELGADLATAGLLAALLAVGQILGDVPAGAVAARLGDRWAMAAAAAVAVVTLTVCALADALAVLALGVLGTGVTNAVFLLARHSYLAEVTPVVHRARVLSTLGGVGRIGMFVGPFLGAALVHATATAAAFWLAVVTTALVVIVLLAVPDVGGEGRGRRGTLRRRAAGGAAGGAAGAGAVAGRGATRAPAPRVTVRRVVADHGRLFATLGVGVLLVGAVRGSRQVLLPLWGEHLGLDPAVTSLVYGISGALDTLVFYPAGMLMDRRGRLAVGVPSMLVLGVAMLLLPLAGGPVALAVLAAAMGLGNGVSAGILMTLGADTAPADVRAQFLGMWRLMQDTGTAAGPLVVSAAAALGSLAAGALTMGAVGVVAAGVLAATVPRWTVHASVRTRVAAGLRADGSSPPGAGEVQGRTR